LTETSYVIGRDGDSHDTARTICAPPQERRGVILEEDSTSPALEFPTSPVIVGRTLCVTSSDGARRDNFPNALGEGAKVSCLDEDLPVR
jgi:hypothetical protein